MDNVSENASTYELDLQYVQTILLPTVGLQNPKNLVVAALYTILFLFGLCGNVSVLTGIRYMTSLLGSRRLEENSRTFVYVIALCIVDSMVLLTIPITLLHLLTGQWVFGKGFCKIYWMVESEGKVLSTFLIAAMSYERYTCVKHPTHNQKALRFKVGTVMVLALLACLLLYPFFHFANISVMFSQRTEIFMGIPTRFKMIKCNTNNMDQGFFLIYTVLIFIFGFCAPAIAIGYSYTCMLCRLHLHAKGVRQSFIPLGRVTKYTIALALFYFICWTPYWVGTLLFIQDYTQKSDTFVFVMYGLHALPYINSSCNWIFYVVLSSQMRNLRQEASQLVDLNFGGSRQRLLRNQITRRQRSYTNPPTFAEVSRNRGDNCDMITYL